MFINFFTKSFQKETLRYNKYISYLDSLSKKIMQPTDTLKLSINEINFKNEAILSLLSVLIENDNSAKNTQEDIRMQMRIFYSAILSVFLVILFTLRKRRKEIFILSSIVIFITAVYFLEIHNTDLYERSVVSRDVKRKASEVLLSNINSRIVYNLKIKILEDEMINWSKSSRCRKIEAALNFDMERFVFYIIPLMFVVFYDIKHNMNLSKKVRRLKRIVKNI